MKHLKHHPINDKFQKLSKLKKEDHTKAKEKKMDGEKYLAETPKKRGGVSKPTNKKLDGEKFLAENASWMPPAMEKELNDLMTRKDINILTHLENYDTYNENKIKNTLLGTALALSTLTNQGCQDDSTINHSNNNFEIRIDDKRISATGDFPGFKYFKLSPHKEYNSSSYSPHSFFASINKKDGTISTVMDIGSRYTDLVGTIIISDNVNTIYYIDDFKYYLKASTNKDDILDKKLVSVNINTLNILEENDKYKILEVPYETHMLGLNGGYLRYIIVNKGYYDKLNEFEVDGEKYSALRVSSKSTILTKLNSINTTNTQSSFSSEKGEKKDTTYQSNNTENYEKEKIENLKELKDLLDNKAISQDEYNKEKSKILSK
jgi:hypothetical protein